MSVERIGTDEWVASVAQRRRALHPAVAAALEAWDRLPWPLRIALPLLPALILPLLTSNDYILRIGGLVFLYATLAIGLNLVVGYVGMLDLGYVAYFGFGAYAYALLSSPQFGLHWPTLLSVPFVTLLVAGLGYLLGLPSLRLQGDYLAIVTLGFGQIFEQLTRTLDRVSVPWSATPINITGGPNGLPNLDRLELLGWRADTVVEYYFVLLGTLVLVFVVAVHLNQSRLGRAWRAIREDTLAAGAMGIPANRLKLLALALGAGLAGFCGTIFAAWQQGVFPDNFSVQLLITLYAMVVLGGVGSLPGMVVGALVITVLPEVLRPNQQVAGTELAALVFYGGVLTFLTIITRPRWRLLLILGAVIVLGIAVRIVVAAVVPESALAVPQAGGLDGLIQSWLVVPHRAPDAVTLGNIMFFVAVGLVVVLTRLPRQWRAVLLVPTLYLLAFVWETRLSKEPSTTRLLIVGALLVVLMAYRPQGMFGQKRVEVV